MVTEADVRRLALALPGASERPSYGTPCFRVRGRPFARIHQEPGLLVVWCADELEKDALMASEPATFFSTPHYDGYALVLARMERLDLAGLRRLLADAWHTRAPARLRAAWDADHPGVP